MKNTLTDLNNALFEQLERLQDDEAMKDDAAFEKEITRSKAITNIAAQIIQNGNLALIDKSVNARLNHMGLRHAGAPELFDTAVLVATIAAEAGRKKHEHSRDRR